MVSYATVKSRCLLAFEFRLTLFEKSFHAFAAVFRGEKQIKRFPLELQTFIERRVRRLEDSFLRRFDRQSWFRCDLPRHSLGFIQQKFDRYNPVHQPKTFRL